MKKLIVATRGSRLALAQTHIVCGLLKEAGVETEVRTITTAGDRDRIHALVKIGGRGIFVREIERELLSGEADIAVHSAKDLPYQLAQGLVIAGTPRGADPRDALVLLRDKKLREGNVVAPAVPGGSGNSAGSGRTCSSGISGGMCPPGSTSWNGESMMPSYWPWQALNGWNWTWSGSR